MRSLKQSGYTNKEISVITGEKWGEPTIKLYTRRINIKVSENNDVKKVLADDGAYDSKGNFRYIDKMKIEPIIRVRKNFIPTTLLLFSQPN